MTARRFGIACAVALVASACTDYDSATNLNPEGPPMVRQVRVTEKYGSATGTQLERVVFGFGSHSQAADDQAHAVTSGKAVDNKLRIILDELLIGNNLEEIACRAPIDGDVYDRVPLGATPDDVARCSTAKDVLPTSCPGSNPLSVCICKTDGGCDGGLVAKGAPVGVLDVNQDGSADDTRFIPDAVQLKCGNVMVPTDVNNSYYNPSGDQNVPAEGGFDALGPAIILKPGVPPNAPAGATGVPWDFLPTNTECSLVFSAAIVDKTNNGVCAPPGGDVAQNCSPGDLTAFKFKVEPLSVTTSPITNGSTNVARNSVIIVRATAPLDPNQVDTATALATKAITFNPALPVGTVVTIPTADTVRIAPPAAGFAQNQMYTISISTALTDFYGQALPQSMTVSFTTGM